MAAALLPGALVFICVLDASGPPARLSLLIFVLGLIGIVRDPRRASAVPKALAAAWAVWLAAGGLSLAWAVDFKYSWREFRYDGLLAGGLFLSLLLLLDRPRSIKIIWAAFLASSFILAVSGYVDFIGGLIDRGALLPPGPYNRARGLAPHVHTYLLTLFLSFPFWAAAVYQAESRRARRWLGAGLAVVFVGWLLGYGRMQTLFLPVLIGLAALIIRRRMRWVNFLAASMLVAGLVFAAWLSRTDLEIKPTIINERQYMWNLSVNYIEQHPFAGLGFGALSYRLMDDAGLSDFPDSPSKWLAPSGSGNHCHNWAINAWLTTGLQGLLALLALGVTLYRRVSPAADLSRGGDRGLRLGAACFCLSLISCVMISMSDTLVVGNFGLLFWVLAASAVRAAGLLEAA